MLYPLLDFKDENFYITLPLGEELFKLAQKGELNPLMLNQKQVFFCMRDYTNAIAYRQFFGWVDRVENSGLIVIRLFKELHLNFLVKLSPKPPRWLETDCIYARTSDLNLVESIGMPEINLLLVDNFYDEFVTRGS